MIGHGLGAAGGLEAIATIKAITTGWVHPTINQYVLHLNSHFSVLYMLDLVDCQYSFFSIDSYSFLMDFMLMYFFFFFIELGA